MNQKEKLSEMIKDWNFDATICNSCNRINGDCIMCSCKELADYLLSNGVIVLPCKVGDTVYCLATPCGGCQCYNEIMCEEFIDRCKNCHRWEIIEVPFSMELYDEFGKTVFLTRKDAETALREREDNA